MLIRNARSDSLPIRTGAAGGKYLPRRGTFSNVRDPVPLGATLAALARQQRTIVDVAYTSPFGNYPNTGKTTGGDFWQDAGNWLEGAYKEIRPWAQGAVEIGKKVVPMVI